MKLTEHVNAFRITGAAALIALAGCANLDNGLSSRQGQLIGAGGGALAGAVLSDGLIAPVIGAVGGAIVGEELAERDPLVD